MTFAIGDPVAHAAKRRIIDGPEQGHLRAPNGSGARRGACAADHPVASAAVARPARTARKVVREELEAVRRHGSARTSARQHWVLGAQHVRASLGEAAERRSSHAEPSRQSARLGQAPKEQQAPTVPGGIPFRAGQRPEAAPRARLMRLGPQGEDAAAAVLPITLCRPLQSSALPCSSVQRSAVLHRAAPCSAVQCSAVQRSAAQCNAP